MKKKRLPFWLAACFLVAINTSVATAAVQFSLDAHFNYGIGSPPNNSPSGAAPWMDVTIYDSSDTNPGLSAWGLGTNEVLIVVSNNLTDTDFVGQVGLNLNSGINLGQLQLADVGHNGAFAGVGFQAPGSIDSSGTYDLLLDFDVSTSTSANRFDGGEKAFIRVSNLLGSLTDGDFLFKSDNLLNPSNTFYTAATIKGIGSTAVTAYIGADDHTLNTDAVPPVPEPATLAIWGMGLGIAGLVQLRRRRK